MVARIPGRVVFDIPVLLRTYYHTFEEYSLDFVAGEMLGKNKTITATGIDKIEEIKRLHREDPATLARYNLTDAVLTKEIFDKAGILPNAIERTKRSGHLLDRSGGSVAAFDYLYLPRLHRAGYVANNAADVAGPDEPLPGGHVLEPTPGIYENVLVFDFRSLYPSIIMTFNIDPLGLHVPTENAVKGPVGPPFAKEGSILPSIIAELMEARAKAKQDNNPYLSYAIKILMNSFYGVLGAAGCRFFNSDLAATITQTGQFILKETIHHIQTVANVPVIYGDTDSLFVLLGPGSEKDAAGRDLAAEITEWLSRMVKERFHVDSALTLQFENHFRYFFMPALRGSTQGSKKHYCGAIVDDSGMKLSFKGMESARSDWTELAKETQYALIMRVFSKQPVEEYLLDVTSKLRSGKLDGKLVYKKRLRKPVSDYTVNVPPHVQAAKLCKTPPHMVRYVMTINGPQPVENLTAPIDYDHYIEAQLKPVADSILEWTGTGFDAIVLGQQDLFA
jgi:DNA polymerase-2